MYLLAVSNTVDKTTKQKKRQIGELIKKVETGLKKGTVKASVADYIRLFQLQKELDDDEPAEIKVTWVEPEKKKSDTSIMPKGLLDKLTREEILDLVAYVVARGDDHHKLFQGVHEHHH